MAKLTFVDCRGTLWGLKIATFGPDFVHGAKIVTHSLDRDICTN